MPQFDTLGGWMVFDRLDHGAPLDYAFTLAFKVTDEPGEHWSERFIRFKNKDIKALYGAAKVLKTALPDLFEAAEFDPEATVIVPALASSEKLADPNRAIPNLATGLANIIGCGVDLTSVTKDPHPSLHSLAPVNRIPTLEAANYAAKKINAKQVLILDDFITQGATLGITARVLKAANPKLLVHGLALAKTERRSYWGSSLSNDHVPKAWDTLWLAGEQKYLDKRKKGA